MRALGYGSAECATVGAQCLPGIACAVPDSYPTQQGSTGAVGGRIPASRQGNAPPSGAGFPRLAILHFVPDPFPRVGAE